MLMLMLLMVGKFEVLLTPFDRKFLLQEVSNCRSARVVQRMAMLE
jgi:hypothetical protein